MSAATARIVAVFFMVSSLSVGVFRKQSLLFVLIKNPAKKHSLIFWGAFFDEKRPISVVAALVTGLQILLRLCEALHGKNPKKNY
ncbi:hypothetical protein ACS3QZ_18025 [Shimia sp. W99]